MTPPRVVSRRRDIILALFAALGSGAALAFSPGALFAQLACASRSGTLARSWSPPLDRVIPLRARDVSLRDGLDRIASAAHFRIAYSAELLPLDRRVCLSVDSIVAGDALVQLLAGMNVEPISIGDQVVLTPVRAPTRESMAEMASSVQTLERVVVTGSATGNAQRSLTVALDVVNGRRLSERGSNTFSSSLDGNVPGLWVWEQSPSSLLTRYGSIRGASSFGVSYPKVYIDGIEVANPLLVTELNPAVLDRIEVIRGPQGAALYGADAISGVVNIVTRNEGTQSGADRTEVLTGAGLSQTAYANAVFAQNHAFTWRGGSNMRSGSLAMNLSTLGGYVPEAFSRALKLNGAVRAITSNASITGTARFYGKQAALGENPLLRGVAPSLGSIAIQARPSSDLLRRTTTSAMSGPPDSVLRAADSLPESVRQYTVGGNLTLLRGGAWTPSFVAGVDGYRLSNVPNDLAPVPSATDSALHAAGGGADRGTLRASLVGQFDLGRRDALTLTLAAEHSSLRETQATDRRETFNGQERIVIGAGPSVVTWRSNSGLIAQGNLSLDNALYVTGGLRLERNDGFTLSHNVALLPMLGLAEVRDFGPLTLKLRGAYGRGIRPAQTPTRAAALRDVRRASAVQSLDPEEQSGIELGFDVMYGRFAGFHLTRFDQTASGLIQPVAIPGDTVGYSSGPGPSKPHLAYVLQNVGEITNRGWELENALNFGSLSIGGAMTLVDSRVQAVDRHYTGDLIVGARMLAVPSRTTSLSLSWNRPRWYANVSASRASDWINYDRFRLATDFAAGTTTARAITGDSLRTYWMTYDGVTRIRATISHDLLDRLSLKLTGDNLTNAQRGEPDNITVLPGRTLLVGLSAKIR